MARDQRGERGSAARAESAILVIDAEEGVRENSKRHGYMVSMLGLKQLCILVNKMDLVDYSESAYDSVRSEVRDWAAKLQIRDIRFLPVSALHGDMVVERGERMPWYTGYTMLGMLENLEISSDRNLLDFRFPVQLVSRPQTDEHRDFRGYAGRIESGAVAVGDDVVVLPGGGRSRVESISTFDGNLDKAYTPM
ncbi:MAG: GTP-binding protein, partial [Candidatus Poseidoniia archaeon]